MDEAIEQKNSKISGFYSIDAWTSLVLEEKRSKLQETIMDKRWTTTKKGTRLPMKLK
jgi:hypothetical protein